jgi:hypothetical protein
MLGESDGDTGIDRVRSCEGLPVRFADEAVLRRESRGAGLRTRIDRL